MTAAVQLVPQSEDDLTAVELDPLLIDAIYGGCLECDRWSYALDLLAEYLDLNLSFISLGPRSTGGCGKIIVKSGCDSAFVQRVCALIPGQTQPLGLVRSTVMKTPDGEVAALYFEIESQTKQAVMRVCLARRTSGSAFTSCERSLLQMYVPTFQKAFETYVTIASQRYALEDYRQTAEQLSITILTITDDMRVIHESGAVEVIFGSDNEFAMDLHNRIYMKGKSQNRELLRHVEQASRSVASSLDPATHVLMLPATIRNGWWSILCKRMHEDLVVSAAPAPCVKLYIRFIPSLVQVTPDIMCVAMGLTPRQAEVATGIVNGMDIDAIAASMGISRNTVRVHVAAIYSRTAVTSRSEFTFVALRRLNNGWC